MINDLLNCKETDLFEKLIKVIKKHNKENQRVFCFEKKIYIWAPDGSKLKKIDLR